MSLQESRRITYPKVGGSLVRKMRMEWKELNVGHILFEYPKKKMELNFRRKRRKRRKWRRNAPVQQNQRKPRN